MRQLVRSLKQSLKQKEDMLGEIMSTDKNDENEQEEYLKEQELIHTAKNVVKLDDF